MLLVLLLICGGIAAIVFVAEGQGGNALLAVVSIVFAIINRALAAALFDISDALLKSDRRDSRP
jgi:hypothetical protein